MKLKRAKENKIYKTNHPGGFCLEYSRMNVVAFNPLVTLLFKEAYRLLHSSKVSHQKLCENLRQPRMISRNLYRESFDSTSHCF